MKVIRKSYLFSSLSLAPLRLGGRIPESECYQFPESFAQATQIFNYSSTEYRRPRRRQPATS